MHSRKIDSGSKSFSLLAFLAITKRCERKSIFVLRGRLDSIRTPVTVRDVEEFRN